MSQSKMNNNGPIHEENFNAYKGTTKKKHLGKINISVSYGKSNEIEMCKHSKKDNMPICHFFLQNRCTRGNACRFSHTQQAPTPTPVQTNSNKQEAFPALCKQTASPTLSTNNKYKQVVSTPLPELEQKKPYVKTKRMVVIYRQFKDGRFVVE